MSLDEQASGLSRSEHAESSRRDEAHYHELFEGLSDAILIADADGRYIDANAAACTLLGYSREQLLQLTPDRIVVADATWRANERARFTKSGFWRGEVEVRRSDGETLYAEVRGQALTLAAGTVHIIILRDLQAEDAAATARAAALARERAAHAEAETARRQLADILESTGEGIYGLDREGRCTFINRAAAEFLGYAPDDVLGREMHTLVHHTRPDGSPYPLSDCPFAAVLRTGENVRAEGEVQWRKDGTPLYVDYSAYPIRQDGVMTGAVIAFADRSERRRIEAALRRERDRIRRLVDANIVGVVFFNTAGDISEANDAFLTIVGYSRADLAAGRLRWDAITPPEFRDLDEQAIAEARSRGVCTPYEKECIRKSGERVPALVGFALLDESPNEAVGFVVDLSERRRAEEALAQLLDRESAARHAAELSEQRYQALAEATLQLVWTAQPDGAVDFFNQRWYEFTGQRPEEALGWGWLAALHPDDFGRTHAHWTQALITGEDPNVEYRLRRADGSYRWYLAHGRPLRDAAGRIVKWFGACAEIDARKQAEIRLRLLARTGAALAGSLDYEATLAAVARLAVPELADWCSIDMLQDDGSIRNLAVAHVDPAKVELARTLNQRYPVDPNDPVGLPNVLRTGRAELYAEIPDELLATTARDEEHLAIARALGLRSAMTVPLTARRRTLGALTLVWAESGRRYTETDLALAEELARRAALAVDNARLYREAQTASAAWRAERDRLQQVLSVMPEGVVVVDARGQIVAQNAAALAIWGWPAHEPAPAFNIGDAGLFEARRLDGSRYTLDELPLTRSLRAGETVRAEQMVVTRYGRDEMVTILASSAPLHDEAGAVGGAVTVFQDISPLKDLERQKDDFLAAVSHDLKNPLTTIKGLAQLLQLAARRNGGPETARIVDGLRTIDSVASRVTGMINEMLDVTRLQMGQALELDRVPADLVALVRRAVSEHDQVTDAHTIRLETDLDELGGQWDVARLMRVLGNLLSNAIKYSPDGGEVTVSLAADERAGARWATLRVRDHGIGMPPAELPRVFERFFRASNALGKISGSGIGLAAVRQIVEQHGGRITAENAADGGAVFTVQLPLNADPPEPESMRTES